MVNFKKHKKETELNIKGTYFSIIPILIVLKDDQNHHSDSVITSNALSILLVFHSVFSTSKIKDITFIWYNVYGM